jgi:hypothetical protein
MSTHRPRLRPPGLEELRALAKEQDRRDGLASKAKGQRGEREEVSEEQLLSLGGKKPEVESKKAEVEIVFGPEGETQLIFKPSKGRFKKTCRWRVSLKGNISPYDTERALSKANRGLWDKGEDKGEGKGEGKGEDKGKPSLPFKAASQLLDCHVEIELQARRTLLLLLLRRMHEKAKGEGVSPIETKPAEGALYIYPKPELETLREQLAVASEQLVEAEEQLDHVSYQLAIAHDAVSVTVEALFKKLWGKGAVGVQFVAG